MDEPIWCRTCQASKPSSEFHQGQRVCKPCRRAARLSWPVKPWLTIPTPPPGLRVCRKCLSVVAEVDFFASTPTYCKSCVSANATSWKRANPEAAKALAKRSRIRRADAERAYRKRWYAEHRESSNATSRAYHAANKERRMAQIRAWQKANPELMADSWRRKRLRRLSVPIVGRIDWKALWTGLCGICGEPLDASIKWPDPMSKSVDHIVPIARGGTHEQANLQFAHLGCNSKKGARQTA